MKILIARVYPNIMDISKYNVQEIGLAKALIKLGHECDIVLYNGKKKDRMEVYKYSNDGKEYTFKIYWLRGINILKNGYLFSLNKLIRNYDVVQVDEYDQLQSWMLYKKQIVPTVVYHGLYESKYTKGYNLKCAVFDKLLFKWFKYEDVVCAAKSKMAADFLYKKGFKKVSSVGVGLDTERFKNDIKSDDIVTNNSKKQLLYIGKIEDRRNSLLLLDIFSELVSRGLDLKLKIIGRGEGEYYIQFLEKAKLLIESGKLIYVESMEQYDMRKEYTNSALFLFPTNFDIFGMVLLEAMYFGCPVISSLNGGSSELIKDGTNGCILNDFSVKNWADKIENLLSNEDILKEYRKNASDTVKNDFLWDSVAKKMIKVYQEALR